MNKHAFPSNNYPPKGTELGMTLRDYFAAAALPGIIAAELGDYAEGDVTLAYEYADLMLAESEKDRHET
jgi:hypothetical protein